MNIEVDTSTYLYKLSKRLWKSSDIQNLGIPNSTVFFVRSAIYERTGVLYSPEHVRISLWLEGHLPPREVTSIPKWYIDDYMGGVEPNMTELTAKVTRLYNMRQATIKAELEVDKPDEL